MIGKSKASVGDILVSTCLNLTFSDSSLIDSGCTIYKSANHAFD